MTTRSSRLNSWRETGKRTWLCRLLGAFLGLTLVPSAFAQTVTVSRQIDDGLLFAESETARQFDLQVSLKTLNYFRGLVPSSSPTLSTSAGWYWPSGMFVGAYGGVGVNDKTTFDSGIGEIQAGHYQETDLFLGLHRPSYSMMLDYYYNFTEGISDVPQPGGIFDFDPQTARGLLDLILQYRFGEERQWQIESSTFLFGLRDADKELQGTPPMSVRTDARYSTYLELQHSRSMSESGLDKLKVRVGAAWRWSDSLDGPNFYADSASVVNVGADYIKYLRLGDQATLPFKVTLGWNPDSDNIYVIGSLSLAQFAHIPL